MRPRRCEICPPRYPRCLVGRPNIFALHLAAVLPPYPRETIGEWFDRADREFEVSKS